MEFLPYMSLDKYVENSGGIPKSGRGYGRNTSSTRDEATNKKRDEILVVLRAKLRSLLASRNETLATARSYTDLFNSWRNRVFEADERNESRTYGDDDGRRIWYVRRSVCFKAADGVVIFAAYKESPVLKLANESVYRELLEKVMTIVVQMDNVPSKESVQGDATQESSKESNTIITRDQSVTESKAEQHELCVDLASSEPTMSFNYLVGRWMPLKTIKVSVNDTLDQILTTYYVPETFLSDLAKCAPNTIPFETFVYGSYDYEFKFVVNANKFQCGKVIVSAKFDSYQADDIQKGFQSHLSRPHVILDLSANNEGVLRVPFRYHRAFVRNLTHSTASVGVRPGKFASVYVSILSPLRTGPGGANDMDIRPFYMIKRADFAGMSYKVPLTQMDTVGALTKALPTDSLKAVLQGVEKTLDQLGKSHNQDKPTDVKGIIVIPRPRLHFPNGKGISDASVLRMNPHALTSYNRVKPYDDDPRTTLDIARIWGLRSTFQWKNDQTEGNELFNSILDPTSRTYTEDYSGQPTPLEYVCGMYQFWSGPIELRFDFVSNAFHTGSVIISAEFNRTSTVTDECQSHSTYTKTFHLGDQKSVMFRVPYIYDTVWRRSTGMVFNAVMEGQSTSDQIKSAAISIRPESRMRVKVRVLNALRPVSSTTSTIDVLVFMRASPTFAVHALKQFDYREERDVVPIDSFPSDNYAPELPDLSSGNRVKRSEEVPENGISYRATRRDRHLPTAVSNKWNERLPITQMDNGEKEDEDTTENFSVGRSALLAQSLDTQVGIKDILRRPTLLFLQKQCLASETGFFIPLMPPSRMMQYVVGKETDFVKTVGQTPQAALMNLFRFWRGSMRYTIIIHKKTGSPPVYVTHVPHSGVRLFSNKTVGTVADKQIPIYGCGLTTEIIVPQVNPTVCVEAPYDTENNWTLTFDEDALRNYSWRDKGDVTSGHLVLSCAEDFKFSVWWHAGDDFEFANFYGIPKMRSNVWAYQWSDEHARVQMDDQGFRSNNVLTHVGTLYSGVKAALTPNLLTKAALCAIPVVGPAYTTANIIAAVDNAQSHMHRITNQLNDKADSAIDRVVATFGVSLNNLVELIQGTVDKVVGGLSWAANLGSYCYDVILDILIAWIDKSWTAVGVSIVRFLGKVLSTKLMTTLMQYGVQLGEVIANIARPQVVEVQAPSRDTTATLLGVLAGVVGTVLGVRINMYRYTSMMSGLVARLTEAGGMSYLVNVLRFVEGTFTIIKDAILGMLGYVTPEAAALKMLSSSSNVLNVFVTEAQLVTSEANTNLLLHPGFRHRFWKTVMQAYQIQKLLATVPSSSASPVLGKLCNDVIKMGNEKFVDISASPVRYEPFVICIEGAAGIGKSELVDSLASSILSNIEFSRPHSGITYYRMPGSKFWSGYRDQPVVVYDDWMNMTDPTAAAQQLSELYQLKSTSLFIPEMASLEEKKIRGNPLVVILLCNQAFPQSVVSNLVSAEKAVYRRRDILLHARKAMEFANVSPREMTVEQQTTFAHLEFMKYRDQTDRNSLSTRPISYEATRDYVVARFARWHAQEQIKVRRRLNNAMSGMAGANINDLRIEDPFHLYYSVSSQNAMSATDSQNAFLPSEVLAAEVTRIAVAVQSFQDAQVAETELPPQPSDPFEITTQGPREAIIATAVSTRLFLGNALTWGVDCLHQWINSKFAPYSGARMECSICQEISYAYAGCPNSTTETSHSVCQSCYVSLTAHNGAHSCPVCRDERFKIHDLEDVARAMGVFSLWCYRTAKSMTDVGDFLIEKFNGSWADAYYMVWRASVSLTAIGSGAATVDEIATLAPFATMVDNFTAPFSFARVQSDAEPIANPFEDTEESQDPLDEDLDIFVCELNQSLLDAVPVNRTEQTICGHRWLRGNAHQVTYIAGSFHVYREGGTVTVPESACFDPLCPFTIDFEVASFYTSYLREKSPLLRSYLHSFYNAGATDPSTQQYYLERIPPVVRPAWMQVATQARDEITALAQGNWWDRLSDTYTHYKQIIWAVVGVSAAVGGIMAIHSIFRATGPSVQYMDSGDNRTIRVRREVRTLQRPPHQGQVHFQSSSDATPDLVDVVKRYVARNYVKIRLEFGGETRLLTAVGLFNRQALLPRHYVKEIRRRVTEGAKIFVGPSMLEHETKEYTFDESDFKVSATTDLATWTLPPSFGMFKDIRKFISLDADLEKSFAPNATLLIAPCRLTPTLTAVPVDVLGIQNSEVVKDVDGETFTAYDVIAYNYSQAGACGSLLLLDRTTRPIVAMHFAGIGAGKRGEGFGVILTQETLREAATNHTCATQMDDVELGSIDDAKIMLGDANVSYLGSVPPELTIFLPKKTKIRPSLIQNVGSLKPLTQPCILDKTDPRYTYDITPLVAGVVKHGQLTKDFPSSWVDRAKERLWDTFISKLKPAIVGASRLTYEEALAGFDNVTYYDPVVLSTSAGFPWCTTQKKRKADYVEIVRNDTGEVTQVLIKDEILKVLKRKEDQRREGVVPFTPFVDTLKDERRKPEKLLKLGGTRVFCNPPLDYVIAMRQNFLHFTAAFMASRFEMQHAVGINVNGTEWTQLARRLISVSPNNVCTIDYSNFGPGFNAGVAQAAMQLMIRWVKENVAGVDERELTCLMEECLNSQHLCVNTVYYQKCGSPSGAPITTVINTLVNQLLILVAWEAIMASEIERAGKYLMEEYQKNVVLFCYGDDLIMSVSDGIRDRFNARTITTFFSDYDIVATDASKSASVVAYGPITKASFLKMTFARHERHKHLWQSQLDWTSINDTTQWVWECANYKEATYENAKAALLAAHGYGKTKFNDFKSQVNQALRMADCPTLSMTWEEVDNLFYPEVVY